MSRKERHFQGITREIRNIPKIIISEYLFVSNNSVSEGKPQTFGANRTTILCGISELIGAFSGPVGAFLGLIGTNSSAPHSRGETAEVSLKRPFLA